ncbi:MFS transporter [Caulobacter sp. KR2-114]|uniref:MFS transporter n=1 Tax=Caulobacter sp. KR2-114 TaxID=3400912 RepID=UPI003C054832
MAQDTVAVGDASLWRHADFLKLWAAQSVSSFGARITREGLPFAAVMSLGAGPGQVGVLAALSMGPSLLVGVFGGGLIDRTRRRGVLIAADLGRALVLASIPLAAWLGVLGLAHLYLAAALVGGLSVAFDIADHAFLPILLRPDQLVDGNSRLAATESAAEVGGPALAGVLFQTLTAPIAIAVNAATYLASAAVLATIRAAEPAPPPAPPGAAGHPLSDFLAGLGAAMGDAVIRPILLITTLSSLFGSFYSALYIIMALKVLGLTPAMLGATIAVGGVGALIGAAAAGPAIRRLGVGPALVASGVVTGAASFLIPLAASPGLPGGRWGAMAMLMGAQLLGDSFGTITEIAARSLRQAVTPQALMGRVGGVFAAAPGLTAVAGALAGGWLGGVIGPQDTVFIASAGVTVVPALGWFSALRGRREMVEIDA